MDLLTKLGARAERRMTPRLHIGLAGAGALIAVFGAIGVGGDNLVDDDGDINRIPGVIITALLIAAGVAILTRVRTGALALAASTAIAVGVPVLLFFLTVDDGSFPPFNIDVVLGVSALAWLVLYLVGPSRGRMVLLVGALVFAPLFVMEETEDISSIPEAIGQSFVGMFGSSSESFDSGSGSFDPDTGEFTFDEDDLESGFDGDVEDDFGFEEPDFPDPSTLGVIALGFGLLYLLGAHVLTRRGFAGTGTPLVVVGALSSYLGVGFLGSDLKEVGSGLVLLALGSGLLFVGAAAARRFTTWFGAIVFGTGVLVLVTKALGDSPDGTAASLVFLLVGIAVVAFAHLLSFSLGEPAEEDERRSFRPETRPEPGEGPAPDDSAFAPPTGS